VNSQSIFRRRHQVLALRNKNQINSRDYGKRPGSWRDPRSGNYSIWKVAQQVPEAYDSIPKPSHGKPIPNEDNCGLVSY